ncbi:olfactomedin-4-like isoform X2 [Petromyzon marinus]|uniref:olfactomedin-4-like isoform X2 n=1 Tax=Petromyzon marinus TaxID=7757 RepID=UPI003F70D027
MHFMGDGFKGWWQGPVQGIAALPPPVSALEGENGTCQCTVILPDTTFPADRVESLQLTSERLTVRVEQQVQKLHYLEVAVSAYGAKIVNLTQKLDRLLLGDISITELDFEILRAEIKEMEILILELKSEIVVSNPILEVLLIEVANVTVMVNALESLDQNNVLEIRRQVAELKRRLQACQSQYHNSTGPEPSYGSCERGDLVGVGQPLLHQLNWRGFPYKYGAWGKDGDPPAGKEESYWVAPLNTDGRLMEVLRSHKNYNDLLTFRAAVDKNLFTTDSRGNKIYTNTPQGAGMVVYRNHLYFNCYNTRDVCKVNLDTNAVSRKPLAEAVFNNRFSYSSNTWQDFDFAVDENGLWLIFSTEASGGNAVLGRVNETDLSVGDVVKTNLYKPGASNAFMACGKLYATRTVSTSKEEVFYVFDTSTGRETVMEKPIVMDKMVEAVQSLSYNPIDNKLYMYNDGYLVTYDLIFKQ